MIGGKSSSNYTIGSIKTEPISQNEQPSNLAPSLNIATLHISLPPPPPPSHSQKILMHQKEKEPIRNESSSNSSRSSSSSSTSSSNGSTGSLKSLSSNIVQLGQAHAMSNSLSSSSSSLSVPTTPHNKSHIHHSRGISNISLPSTINDYIMTHDHLKPGNNAELLSYDKTITLYRENAKKSNDPDMQCELAIYLYEASKSANHKPEENKAYIQEAVKILRSLASHGHPDSQYYLANIYTSGILSKSGKPDFSHAFPLFVQAAKHQHAGASYRAGKCYEDGLGCLKNKSKAIQFYKVAATLNHPGAMFRIGLAEIDGSLGLSRNVRNGEKWLKRSAVAATPEYPHALHELGLLHEKGLDGVIFRDTHYSTQLYARAAELGYAPSAYRLGECFEFGYLGCRKDASSSIFYYTIAAHQGDPNACFALSAWYLAGDPPRIPVDEEKAVYWAKLAADKGLAKAEFALGYFAEAGIGRPKNKQEALNWYSKAASQGDEQAKKRIPIVTASLRSYPNSNISTTNLNIPAALVPGKTKLEQK